VPADGGSIALCISASHGLASVLVSFVDAGGGGLGGRVGVGVVCGVGGWGWCRSPGLLELDRGCVESGLVVGVGVGVGVCGVGLELELGLGVGVCVCVGVGVELESGLELELGFGGRVGA